MNEIALPDRSDVFASFVECQMPRTKFQLERFVIGAHDTDEMKFVQVCRELENLYFTVKNVNLQMAKIRLEIESLRLSDDPIDAIDADIKQLGLEQTELTAVGAMREIKALLEIYDQIPHFTREQIDASQPDYWQARLTRQTNIQIASGSVPWAQLEALQQASSIEINSAINEQERLNA